MAKPLRARQRIKKKYSRGGPNPIDIHVGSRVRLRRNLPGMTLQTLAKVIGVTYQHGVTWIWAGSILPSGLPSGRIVP